MLGLSSCNHDDPPPPPPAIERVAFVYDVSRSTTGWQTDMKWSTLHLMEDVENAEFAADFFTMDAHGGSQDCTVETITVSGQGGANDTVQSENRTKAMRELRTKVGGFLECEAAASTDIGTDLQLQSLVGYDRVIIMTDGFLHVKQEPVLNFGLEKLNNLDALRTQIDEYLDASPADLDGAKVEVYGLGFRADLSSVQGNNLNEAWQYLLDEVNAEVVVIQEKMP